eukprot:scaffold7232_cov63-Cyclotella_meneghiniana.AAC.4
MPEVPVIIHPSFRESDDTDFSTGLHYIRTTTGLELRIAIKIVAQMNKAAQGQSLDRGVLFDDEFSVAVDGDGSLEYKVLDRVFDLLLLGFWWGCAYLNEVVCVVVAVGEDRTGGLAAQKNLDKRRTILHRTVGHWGGGYLPQ